MADSMYRRRRKIDDGHPMHDSPHAKALYLRGVHDTLTAMREWASCTPETIKLLLDELHKQSAP